MTPPIRPIITYFVFVLGTSVALRDIAKFFQKHPRRPTGQEKQDSKQ